MKQDIEISATRRPEGRGLWIDGRCGLVILFTLFATVLFNIGYEFRDARAASEQHPLFSWLAFWFRVIGANAASMISAPLSWALRRAWAYLAAGLVFDLYLLLQAFAGPKGNLLEPAAYGGTALKILVTLSAILFAVAFARSLTPTFLAGVETSRLYGWKK